MIFNKEIAINYIISTSPTVATEISYYTTPIYFKHQRLLQIIVDLRHMKQRNVDSATDLFDLGESPSNFSICFLLRK